MVGDSLALRYGVVDCVGDDVDQSLEGGRLGVPQPGQRGELGHMWRRTRHLRPTRSADRSSGTRLVPRSSPSRRLQHLDSGQDLPCQIGLGLAIAVLDVHARVAGLRVLNTACDPPERWAGPNSARRPCGAPCSARPGGAPASLPRSCPRPARLRGTAGGTTVKSRGAMAAPRRAPSHHGCNRCEGDRIEGLRRGFVRSGDGRDESALTWPAKDGALGC